MALKGKTWIPAFAGMTREAWSIDRYSVYILASERNGTLYVGVTSNLVQRIYQHKEGVVAGFTRRYDVKRLVYFEQHGSIEAAIHREKQIKDWKRAWKIELIEENNPEWEDLYARIAEP